MPRLWQSGEFIPLQTWATIIMEGGWPLSDIIRYLSSSSTTLLPRNQHTVTRASTVVLCNPLWKNLFASILISRCCQVFGLIETDCNQCQSRRKGLLFYSSFSSLRMLNVSGEAADGAADDQDRMVSRLPQAEGCSWQGDRLGQRSWQWQHLGQISPAAAYR